jgi:hypothetical protein
MAGDGNNLSVGNQQSSDKSGYTKQEKSQALIKLRSWDGA